MSDASSSASSSAAANNPRYAPGHHACCPVPVRHHIYRLPDANGPAQLHITAEDGTHYLFSLQQGQTFSGVRQGMEVVSRMSGRK